MPNSATEQTTELSSTSSSPPPASASSVTETSTTSKRIHSAQGDKSEEDRLPTTKSPNTTVPASAERPLRLVKRHKSEHNIRGILGADPRGEISSTQPSTTHRSASVSVLPDFRRNFLPERFPEMDPRYDNADSLTGGASLSSSSSSSNVTSNARAARQRTAIACLYCRRRKIRCSGFDPGRENSKCTNCTRFNQACIFAPVSSLTAPVRQVSVDQPHQPQQPATPQGRPASQQQPTVAPHAPPGHYAPAPYPYYGYQYGYYTPYDTSAGHTQPAPPPPPPPPASMMTSGYATYSYMMPHYAAAAQQHPQQHPPPHPSQQQQSHNSQRSQSESHSQTLSPSRRRPSAVSLRHLSLPDSSTGLPALSSTSSGPISTSAPPISTQGFLDSHHSTGSSSSSTVRDTSSRKPSSSSKQGKSNKNSRSGKSESAGDDAKKRGKMKISDLLE